MEEVSQDIINFDEAFVNEYRDTGKLEYWVENSILSLGDVMNSIDGNETELGKRIYNTVATLRHELITSCTIGEGA